RRHGWTPDPEVGSEQGSSSRGYEGGPESRCGSRSRPAVLGIDLPGGFEDSQRICPGDGSRIRSNGLARQGLLRAGREVSSRDPEIAKSLRQPKVSDEHRRRLADLLAEGGIAEAPSFHAEDRGQPS